jgi:adenylate cyclase
MEDRNVSRPETEHIRFRIGINLGDVMVDEGDIFGDGVNVAARLQALVAPGEICVSYSVREQVGEKLPIGFADMGQHGVKNIARPFAGSEGSWVGGERKRSNLERNLR